MMGFIHDWQGNEIQNEDHRLFYFKGNGQRIDFIVPLNKLLTIK